MGNIVGTLAVVSVWLIGAAFVGLFAVTFVAWLRDPRTPDDDDGCNPSGFTGGGP